ncbi:DUF2867 domain-containing protein [Arcobacter aquimarinus]|uniref:DUF2867 domain-containing protein n=1 Tax=Arcobacter aquimarinus TaxID=1315211 RepID=UPI003BB21C59
MNNKVIVSFLPDYSNANNFISKIDFADSYKIESLKDEEIKEIYLKLLSNNSTLIKSLMSFRNKIMSLFGFKTEIKYSNNIKDIQVGNKVGFFSIYYIDEHEIIAGEKDKHLDFCVSFYKNDTDLTVTTLVQYNNFFGKIYMTFVKPFHKIVVKNMLKNLR